MLERQPRRPAGLILRELAQPQSARRRRQGHHRPGQGCDPRRQPAGAGRSLDRRQASTFRGRRPWNSPPNGSCCTATWRSARKPGPSAHKATITLTDNVKGEDVMAGMGDRGIMLSGGTLNLHGDRTNTWTKLASTAKAGSLSIQVLPNARPSGAWQRDRSRLDGLRPAAGRAAHHCRDQWQHDHAGEAARLHAPGRLLSTSMNAVRWRLSRNIKIGIGDAEQSFFGGIIRRCPRATCMWKASKS